MKPTQTMPADTQNRQQEALSSDQLAELKEQLTQAQTALTQAKESELRSRADYQNLVRRTQEEKRTVIKFATKDLLMDLLQPLDHLSLAAAQLNDPGLTMTIDQLWKVLRAYGLEEINPLHQPFDVALMEATEKQGETQDDLVVTTVVKKGYKLQGEVIQHAKVIVGEKTKKNGQN